MGKSQKQSKVICIGLDNSGKSTILNKLKPDAKKVIFHPSISLIQSIITTLINLSTPFGQTTEVFATVGYESEKFKHGNTNFSVFDMSGQGQYRNLWEMYYQDVEGIIFVVDSADTIRMVVAKDELDTMLAHKAISSSKCPILFFANKIDLPKCLSPDEVGLFLCLHLSISLKNFRLCSFLAILI